MKATELVPQGKECGYCVDDSRWGPYGKKAVALIWILSTIVFSVMFWLVAFSLRDRQSQEDFGAAFSMLSIASLVSALALFSYIMFNVIGDHLYYFDDELQRLHCHLKDPTDESSPWYGWWLEHRDTARIYKLRFGGWFRTSEIMPHQGWRIWSWRGKCDPVLIGISAQGTLRMTGWTLGEIDSFIAEFHNLYDLIASARQGQRIGAESDVRDHLGREIMRWLCKVDEQRDTLGRSKHGQASREHFEQVMRTMPLAEEERIKLSDQWRCKIQPTRTIVGSVPETRDSEGGV